MAGDKKDNEKKVVDSGMRNVKFLKAFGSYKKGDEKSYHISTIKSLIANKTCEIVK